MAYYHYHENQKISRENALAAKSLAASGTLPNDHYWNALRSQHDKNPIKFDRTHNYVVSALLDRDLSQRQGTLGAFAPLLPKTGFFALANYRHNLHAANFDKYHPFLGRLLEIAFPATPVTTVPVTTIPVSIPATAGQTLNQGNLNPDPGSGSTTPSDGGGVTNHAVPEPASALLIGLAIAFMLVGSIAVRRFRSRGVAVPTPAV